MCLSGVLKDGKVLIQAVSAGINLSNDHHLEIAMPLGKQLKIIILCTVVI
jgi:hypothetical protein